MVEDLNTKLAKTRHHINLRTEMGDQLTSSRLIEHSADFRKRKAAEAAAHELRALGYDVSLGRLGLMKVALEASKQSSVDPATAEAFTREIFSVIRKHGGHYDGWGAYVVEG